jgi:LysR family transcriptional regulator (chromosome initiation inhibitor)
MPSDTGFDPAQLEALVAIADHGTFDAAARALHVTPSAVSQRVRTLESTVGQVVVQRSTPCRPTPAGEVLLRLARQTRLLQDEAADELSSGHRLQADLPVAVNADSLATWFRGAVAEAAGWTDLALRLHVEDQAHTAGLLRRGEVLAAVTSEVVPVQGCTTEALGVLRYFPAAAPDLVSRFRKGRSVDWARMPVVVFNEKDRLQDDLLEARGLVLPPVVHRVPTSADFLEAVCVGLGWGAVPEPQLREATADGRLERLSRDHLDVPLHWQRWRIDSPALARLTDAVRRAARAGLRTPIRQRSGGSSQRTVL